jgi:hypothetical protein
MITLVTPQRAAERKFVGRYHGVELRGGGVRGFGAGCDGGWEEAEGGGRRGFLSAGFIGMRIVGLGGICGGCGCCNRSFGKMVLKLDAR